MYMFSTFLFADGVHPTRSSHLPRLGLPTHRHHPVRGVVEPLLVGGAVEPAESHLLGPLLRRVDVEGE